MCLAIIGCAATPVGDAPGGPVSSKLLTYAPPDVVLWVDITSSGHLYNTKLGMNRNTDYDNHSSRPATIPSNYVAYTSIEIVFEVDHTYIGDVLIETSLNAYEPVDDEPASWTGGNTLILIH